jgi:hypothetical protein
MPDWRYSYHPQDLDYLSRKAKAIGDVSAVFGVPPLGIVGAIAREMTLERYEYPNNLVRRAAQPLKELLTSTESDPGTGARRPITHATIADYFTRSNTLPRDAVGNRSYFDRLMNPSFFDVGPGNVKIRSAISMLQNYNRMFPDSDPLDLKRYNDRYDLLVRDLKNPDSDTTIKIAGLVAREGQDFFVKAMTPQRWAALSEDQRAALLTKYYAVGKERLEDDFQKRGGDPKTYMPDLNSDGSDMYLYDPGNGNWSNPARLRDALSPRLRTQNTPDAQPSRMVDAGPGADSGNDRQMMTVQPLAARDQPGSSTLPPQVVANADYLRANGFAITPRTMYVAHVIGPERAVDLFRTRATGSPDVPPADAATGQQVRAWVRALRGAPPAAPALNVDLTGSADGTGAQPGDMPGPYAPPGVSGPPPGAGAFALGKDAALGMPDVASSWPQ